MTSFVGFDDAIPSLAALSLEHFGRDATESAVFLRDAAGRVTLVLRTPVSIGKRAAFDKEANAALGAYVDGPSATPTELFDPDLSRLDIGFLEPTSIDGYEIYIRLLDRRIVGQDWNSPDFAFKSKTPVITFFSCKGGVGRSTALAISAVALSDAGFNVLILDLDLEAPGIGSIFLKRTELPEFGALDYLVEAGANPLDADFLENCIAPSPLTAGKGLIEVMPATGRRSSLAPQNVLPKLGRAFIEKSVDGNPQSFMGQVQELVKALSSRGRSSVILVDSRAGLSESSAATVVGLGGTVLMFGVDTPQTFECYRYLFAQLNRYAISDQKQADWRFGLQMVHAKAGRGVESYDKYRDQCLKLFSEFLYDEVEALDFDAFNFDVDDDSAPHYAWPIPYDAEFAEFDPTSRRDQLSREFFDRSFGPFVKKVIDIVRLDEGLSFD